MRPGLPPPTRIPVPQARGTALNSTPGRLGCAKAVSPLIGDKGAYGIPRVKIDWRTCAIDLDGICKAYRLLKPQIAASRHWMLDFDDEQLRGSVVRLAAHLETLFRRA